MKTTPDSSESFAGATSKFRVGQHCLTIKQNGKIKAGIEVVLTRPADNPFSPANNRRPIPEQCWHTDRSYDVGGYAVIWKESSLMPLDDPKTATELRKERLDMLDQRMAELGKALGQFSSMLANLEQQLKKKAI